MKRLSVILFFILPFVVFSQDPHFTQFYSSPLYLNPSLAGSAGASRIAASYRNQWPAISGNFVTLNFTYDQHINFLKGGIGVNFLRDFSGDAGLSPNTSSYGRGRKRYSLWDGIFETTRIGIIYAPSFLLKQKIAVRPSFEIDFFRKEVDWSKMTFGDMIDSRYGFVYSSKEIPVQNSKSGLDFSTGILVNTDKWHSGVAIHHVTQPDEGLLGNSKLRRKFSLHGSYIFSKNDSADFAFAPAVLFKWQGPFRSSVFIANFNYKIFLWGLGYRNNDAALILLGFNSKFFRLRYSYDITVSKLSSATGGSHEVTAGVLFNYKNIAEKGIFFKDVLF